MGNAFLLTHDPKYFEPLRRQLANLYAVKKEENGRVLLPNKYGDQGWYGYTANEHIDVQRDLYLWSMDKRDLEQGDYRPGVAAGCVESALASLRAQQAASSAVKHAILEGACLVAACDGASTPLGTYSMDGSLIGCWFTDTFVIVR